MTATATRRLNYTPTSKQQVFHGCPADEVLYGGAAGGGKSRALVSDGIMECIRRPGASVIVFRRTSPELMELIDLSKDMLLPLGDATYNENQQRWKFSNGASLRFSHLQFYDDVRKHQGAEYSLILYDEMTHFMPEQLQYLRSRNRVSSEIGAWTRTRGATNPGGVGHMYIRDYFQVPSDTRQPMTDAYLLARYDQLTGQWLPFPPGTRGTPEPMVVWYPPMNEEEQRQSLVRIKRGASALPQLTRCFIPAFVQDNPYIDEDGRYEANLLSLPDAQKQALYYGNWDVFEGQFFTEFDPAKHVIDPILPPEGWPVWRSLDWGYAKPLCCLWHTQNPETKQFITFRELYRPMLRDGDACKLIMEMTPDHEGVRYTMADPSMWRGDSNDAGLSHADTYQKYGVHLLPATNDRVTGWTRLRDLLAHDPQQSQPGWVITRNCTNLIATLPQLVYDENNPEDLDTDGPDHAADSARYFFISAGTLRKRFSKPPKTGSFRRS